LNDETKDGERNDVEQSNALVTCIVGIRHEGGVLLGSDTCNALNRYARGKLFPLDLRGSVAIGVSGSARTAQLIGHVGTDGPAGGEDPHIWAVEELVPDLREILAKASVTMDSCFLLAVGDRLFKIDEDLYVSESCDAFDACGSGEDYALGALHALYRSNAFARTDAVISLDVAKDRALRALKAAEKFDVHVRSPFEFLELYRALDERRLETEGGEQDAEGTTSGNDVALPGVRAGDR
jgi:ATP-dependent protease HslVU (ClpYQ) peptidase subunit